MSNHEDGGDKGFTINPWIRFAVAVIISPYFIDHYFRDGFVRSLSDRGFTLMWVIVVAMIIGILLYIEGLIKLWRSK